VGPKVGDGTLFDGVVSYPSQLFWYACACVGDTYEDLFFRRAM